MKCIGAYGMQICAKVIASNIVYQVSSKKVGDIFVSNHSQTKETLFVFSVRKIPIFTSAFFFNMLR